MRCHDGWSVGHFCGLILSLLDILPVAISVNVDRMVGGSSYVNFSMERNIQSVINGALDEVV